MDYSKDWHFGDRMAAEHQPGSSWVVVLQLSLLTRCPL